MEGVCFSPDGKHLLAEMTRQSKSGSSSRARRNGRSRAMQHGLQRGLQPRRQTTGLGQRRPNSKTLGPDFWSGRTNLERTRRARFCRHLFPRRQTRGFRQFRRRRETVGLGYRTRSAHARSRHEPGARSRIQSRWTAPGPGQRQRTCRFGTLLQKAQFTINSHSRQPRSPRTRVHQLKTL